MKAVEPEDRLQVFLFLVSRRFSPLAVLRTARKITHSFFDRPLYSFPESLVYWVEEYWPVGNCFPMSLRERVARNLRRLRHDRSMSQEELAYRAKINRNYVGMLEREEYAVSIDTLEKLSIALDVDPVEFFRDDG